MPNPDLGRNISGFKTSNQPKYTAGVLLAKGDARLLSDEFTVVDTPVRIVAFNLSREIAEGPIGDYEPAPVPSDYVQIIRVWRPADDMNRDACGNLLAGGEVFESPLRYNRRLVQLTYEQNELVIDAVGTYRVQYIGDNRPEIHVIKMLEPVTHNNDITRGAHNPALE